MTIEELLNTAKERGASDLHVTVGIPPKIRVNGELTDMDYPRMLPQDVEAVIKPTMSEKVKQAFREKGEIDYAYSISAWAIPRQCVQAEGFHRVCYASGRNGGTAGSSAWCPRFRGGTDRKKEGACAGDRTDRERKIDHACLAD